MSQDDDDDVGFYFFPINFIPKDEMTPRQRRQADLFDLIVEKLAELYGELGTEAERVMMISAINLSALHKMLGLDIPEDENKTEDEIADDEDCEISDFQDDGEIN